MFAVIKTGGKQYKVAAEDRITVMSLEGEAGAVEAEAPEDNGPSGEGPADVQ